MKKYILNTCAFIIISSSLFAGNEEWMMSLNGNEIAQGASIHIQDQHYGLFLSQQQGNYFDVITQEIEVRFRWDDTDRNRAVKDNWAVTVHYDLTLVKSDATVVSYTNQSITVDFDISGSFSDVTLKVYNDFEFIGSTLQVTSVDLPGSGTYAAVTGTGNGVLPKDLWLDVILKSEKHFFLDNTIPIEITKSEIITEKNYLDLAWTHVDHAEYYDLEWLFCDLGNKTTQEMIMDEVDDEYDFRNAIRIRIRENFFQIPLAYPSGRLLWRIRPVGYKAGSGDWSTGYWNFPVSGNVGQLENIVNYASFTTHWGGLDLQKNWIYQATYAEDGRMAEVLSFADGSMRARQQISISPEDQLAIVQNSVYDAFGRPTLNVLPAPLQNEGLQFYENMLLTADGYYDYTRFDQNNNFSDPEAMIAANGSQGPDYYFSTANTTPFGFNGKLTPDAEHYPFSRTILANDGSGRVLEQSGVGETFHIGRIDGGEHTTRYVYGNPTGQEELDRLFGNEVGNVSQYKKTSSIDPNGQAYITYTDQSGRTIATAMAGDNPDNLEIIDGLDPDNNGEINGTEMLVDLVPFNEDPTPGETILKLQHSFIVTETGTYTFYYGLDSKPGIESCSCAVQPSYDPQVCDDCHYKLTMYLYDNATQSVITNATIDDVPQDGSITETNGVFVIPDFYDEYEVSATLNSNLNITFTNLLPGSYTIFKELELINAEEVYNSFISGNMLPDELTGECVSQPEIVAACPDCQADCDETFTITINNITYYIHPTEGWLVKSNGTLAQYFTYDGGAGEIPSLINPQPSAQITDPDAMTSYYESLIEDCKSICNGTSVHIPDFCDAYREALLTDMLPGGQYFDNLPDATLDVNGAPTVYTSDENGDGISTGISGWLNANLIGDFLNGTDIDGVLSSYYDYPTYNWTNIRSDWNSIYTSNTNYTISEFQDVWIQQHPEYCIFENQCKFSHIIQNYNIRTGEYYDVIVEDDFHDYYTYLEKMYEGINSANFSTHWFNSLNMASGATTDLDFTIDHPEMVGDPVILDSDFLGNVGLLSSEFSENFDWSLIFEGDDQYSPGANLSCSEEPKFFPVQKHLEEFLKIDATTFWSIWYVIYLTNRDDQDFEVNIVGSNGWNGLPNTTKTFLQSLNDLFVGNLGDPQNPLRPIDFYANTYQFYREVYLQVLQDDNCEFGSCNCCPLQDNDASALTYKHDGFEIRLPVNDLVALVVDDFKTEVYTNNMDPLDYHIPDDLFSDFMQNNGLDDEINTASCQLEATQLVNELIARNQDCFDNKKATDPELYDEVFEAAVVLTSGNCSGEYSFQQTTIHVNIGGDNADYEDIAVLFAQYDDLDCPTGAWDLTVADINLQPEIIECSCSNLNQLLSTNSLDWETIIAEYSLVDFPGGQYSDLLSALAAADPNDDFNTATVNLQTIYQWMSWCTESIDTDEDEIGDAFGYEFAGLNDHMLGLPFAMNCEDDIQTAKCNCSIIQQALQVAYPEEELNDYAWDQSATSGSFSTFTSYLENILDDDDNMPDMSDVQVWRTNCQFDGALSAPVTFENLPSALSCAESFVFEMPQLEDCAALEGNAEYDAIYALEAAAQNAEWQLQLEEAALAHKEAFIQHCFGDIQQREMFKLQYDFKEYYYTLYYYDQAGNLLKTVPPAGVRTLSGTQLTDCAAHREDPESNDFVHTQHHFVTNYWYDTFNQLIRQYTPDGGMSQFWYDELGRIVASQNAKQKEANECSYTLYDELSRPYEAGVVEYETTNPGEDDPVRYHINYRSTDQQIELDGNDYLVWITSIATRKEVVRTWYDETMNNADLAAEFSGGQQNIRNRVSGVAYATIWNIVDDFEDIYDNASHYSYDIHGNVNHLAQENRMLNGLDQSFKHMTYRYDQLSGKVHEVAYEPGSWDQWIHRYAYDKNNRLREVFTSRGGRIWERDAKYHYTAMGSLARTELGQHQVQGSDFAYTLNGWIKAMNSNALSASTDIGKDNLSATDPSGNGSFAGDAFSYSLTFFRDQGVAPVNADFRSIGGSSYENFLALENSSVMAAESPNLFNGNIARMMVNYAQIGSGPIAPQLKGFKYDQLNRIKQSKSIDYSFTSLQSNNYLNASPGSAFETNYSYDLNGNITNLNRKNATTQFDALTYSYLEYSNSSNNSFEAYTPFNGVPVGLNVGNHYSNRLGSVDDTEDPDTESTDIDDQDEYNYTYDEIGQLKSDDQEEIAEIVWNVTGKVLNIVRTSASSKPDLMFHYDAMGNRIVKIVISKIPSQTPGEFEPQSQDEWDYTFYSRDASGNVMAVYSKSFSSCTNEDFSFVESLDLTELHIYGSSRIGMRDGKGNTISNCLNSSGAPAGIQVAGVTYEVMTGMSYSSIDEEVTSELNQNSNEPCSTYFTLIEYKTFELSDHLGNVSATISDRKITVWNTNQDAVVSYNPDILSQQDYYPFGMGIPGRSYTSSTDYRFGYQNQESYDELWGGASYFKYRIADSRIGRFFSTDPIAAIYPWNSTYAFSENRVIDCVELEGLEKVHYTLIKVEGVAVQLNITRQRPGGTSQVFQTYHYEGTMNGQVKFHGEDKMNANINTIPWVNSIMANVRGSGSITTAWKIRFMTPNPGLAAQQVLDQQALRDATTNTATGGDFLFRNFGAYNQFNIQYADIAPAAPADGTPAPNLSTRISNNIDQGFLAGNPLITNLPGNVRRVLLCTDGTPANVQSAQAQIDILMKTYPDIAFALINDVAAINNEVALSAAGLSPAGFGVNDVLVTFNPAGNMSFPGGAVTFGNIPEANIDMNWTKGNGSTVGPLIPIAPVMNANGVTNTNGNPIEIEP